MSHSPAFLSSVQLLSSSRKFLVHPASTPIIQSTCSFTRWCRKMFEIDDIREANIYCGTNDCEVENVDATTNGECKQGEDNTQEQMVVPTLRASRKENTFFTWKLPRKLQFSYSTIPNRPAAKRRPNPFAPNTPPPLRARTMSMVDNRVNLGVSPIMEEPVPTRAMRSMPSLGEAGIESEGHRVNDWDREREEEHDEFLSSPRVIINPPHPPWDDNSLPDQPYENPYYTLPIKDALWLPMNPIGTLDLDMTVTTSVALTSEPGAGHLGPLSERLTSVGSVLSGLTLDLESAISVSGDEMSIGGLPLEGTGEIELAPTIASRVQNLKGDGDVSTTDQQSDLLRTTRLRPNTSGSVASQSKRPGANLLTGSITQLPLSSSPLNSPPIPTATSEVPPLSPSLLTGSLGSVSSGALLRTAGTADRRTYSRYMPMDEAGRLTAKRHTQSSPPRRMSLNRMRSTNSIAQYSFLPPPSSFGGSRFAQRSMTSHVSAQSVAIQEALNEETEVLQRSHTMLQEEAEKQNAPRSRWTSWAFRDREQTTSHDIKTHRP